MSPPTTERKGGLVLGTPAPQPVDQGPLQDGADVSWIPRCNVGENQGDDAACSMFAVGNWSEIMFRRSLSSAEMLALYRANAVMGGLSVPSAFRAAQSAGWMGGRSVCMSTQNLDLLDTQPIIAAYAITEAWDRVNPASGCLDHNPKLTAEKGLHAVVIVAKLDGKIVQFENSWGPTWGYHGLGQMDYALHLRLCRGLWVFL
jgi:hypothetical protein